MRRRQESWGTIPQESMPGLLFELKQWADDTAPRIAEHEERLDTLEGSVREFKTQLREATAAVKAGVWIVGVLWAVTIVVVGFWLAR